MTCIEDDNIPPPPRPKPPTVEKIHGPFPAKFVGPCAAGCGLEIMRGQEIILVQFSDRDNQSVMHDSCWEEL